MKVRVTMHCNLCPDMPSSYPMPPTKHGKYSSTTVRKTTLKINSNVHMCAAFLLCSLLHYLMFSFLALWGKSRCSGSPSNSENSATFSHHLWTSCPSPFPNVHKTCIKSCSFLLGTHWTFLRCVCPEGSGFFLQVFNISTTRYWILVQIHSKATVMDFL